MEDDGMSMLDVLDGGVETATGSQSHVPDEAALTQSPGGGGGAQRVLAVAPDELGNLCIICMKHQKANKQSYCKEMCANDVRAAERDATRTHYFIFAHA